MAVEQSRVGTVAQQQGADLHSVFRRCFVERGELPQVHGVHTCSVLGGGKEEACVSSLDLCWTSLKVSGVLVTAITNKQKTTAPIGEQGVCDERIS